MSRSSPSRKMYPTDLTEQQWALIQALLPSPKNRYGGRPRTVAMREVVNAIMYLNRTGCQWDMLPHDLLPKSTVYDYFAQWRDDGTWTARFDAYPPFSRRWLGFLRFIHARGVGQYANANS